MKFREYVEKIEEYAAAGRSGSGNVPGVHDDGPGSGFGSAGGMAALPSHWTNTETMQNKLASIDGVIQKSISNMDLNQGKMPLIWKDTRVMYLRKQENPIYVHLEDGTRLYLTRGEWQRAGQPDVGKRIVVALQRRMDDKTGNLSQVHYCRAL